MPDITPLHDFMVAIDSDGCVFDTMELKHKECFIPCFINAYELQAVSKYARETWEFVNLYSKSRGVNRFPALIETLDRLQQRPEVIARGVQVAAPESLRAWVKAETRLGNPALHKKVEETNDPVLAEALRWSVGVNGCIEAMVRHVPPFPFVRECLETLEPHVDMLVCSATPVQALEAEWREHDIARYVGAIRGQEDGTKKELLQLGKLYRENHVLMVGDAPGDYAAAKANNCLFYPINPGAEEASWQRFLNEGIPRFLAETFAGEYQEKLLAEFDASLPEAPSWRTVPTTA